MINLLNEKLKHPYFHTEWTVIGYENGKLQCVSDKSSTTEWITREYGLELYAEDQKRRADELEKENDILKHNIRVELDSNRNMYIRMCEEKLHADELSESNKWLLCSVDNLHDAIEELRASDTSNLITYIRCQINGKWTNLGLIAEEDEIKEHFEFVEGLLKEKERADELEHLIENYLYANRDSDVYAIQSEEEFREKYEKLKSR